MARQGSRATIVALVVLIAATVVAVGVFGLPLSHDTLFLWVVLGLLVFSLSDVKGWARGVVFDWLPFLGFLVAYDIARGLADNLGIAAHTSTGIDFDHALFGSPIPTNFLQSHLYHPGEPHWYDYGAFVVYMSHFFVTIVAAAVLWRVAYPQFKRFRTMVLTLAGAGFLTYALFPATPPWMAAEEGRLPFIQRTIGEMWGHFHVLPAASLFENGNGFVNDVAAVPSLHAAYPVLVLLFFWGRVSTPWRVLLVAYPLAMAFTLVYTGEHYVFDVMLGWVYGVGIYALVVLVERWRAREKTVGASALALEDSRVRA
jgi:hypothetical protein